MDAIWNPAKGMVLFESVILENQGSASFRAADHCNCIRSFADALVQFFLCGVDYLLDWRGAAGCGFGRNEGVGILVGDTSIKS